MAGTDPRPEINERRTPLSRRGRSLRILICVRRTCDGRAPWVLTKSMSPGCYHAREFSENLSVALSKPLQHMKRVVRAVYDVQRGERHQRVAEWTQQGKIGQAVTRALEKEHRNLHAHQMLSPLDPWTARRM